MRIQCPKFTRFMASQCSRHFISSVCTLCVHKWAGSLWCQACGLHQNCDGFIRLRTACFKPHTAILLLNALRTWSVLSVTDRKLCFRFRITSLVHGTSLWSRWSLMTDAGTVLTEQILQCVILLLISTSLTTLHTRADYHYMCIVRNEYCIAYSINWFVTKMHLRKSNKIKYKRILRRESSEITSSVLDPVFRGNGAVSWWTELLSYVTTVMEVGVAHLTVLSTPKIVWSYFAKHRKEKSLTG
jgi:hypothetical protein